MPPQPDRYFTTSDGCLARLAGGWERQIWQPNAGQWVDYPDLDVAGECSEITPEQAQQMGADIEGHGEFAATGDQAS